MTERLLQFIWQFQYFNNNSLQTDEQQSVQVIHPGLHNTNQGPDFTNAKIKINDTVWAGSVELHLKTSDWIRHRHSADKNYDNVILHVVWEDDGKTSNVPVIELSSRVPGILLQRYSELMQSTAFIPCEKSFATIPALTVMAWKERLLAERLMRKNNSISNYLLQNNYHWEETFWWLLARSFGTKVNADAFEAVAKSVPLALLAKNKHQIHQLEALLLGQAGLLKGKYQEDYPQLLQREYAFQQNKYKIQQVPFPSNFLRMRPGNFPTIRLAQLAMLVHESAHLFSKIKEAGSVKDVKKWFDITANDYWHYHYRFDDPSAYKKKKLGGMMINSILINTVVPVLFAYGNYHGEQKYKDKALRWLGEIAAEKNSITSGFEKMNAGNTNAFDSQAFVELKNEYCLKKRCLECGLGTYLLKPVKERTA